MELTMYAHPGKFEGELALAPLAYETALDGFGETYDFGGDGYVDHYTVCQGPIEVTAQECEMHGLTDADCAFANDLLGFIVHENDHGFVSVTWYQKGKEVKMAEATGKLDTAMGEFERVGEGE